jgi:hypothetical protein
MEPLALAALPFAKSATWWHRPRLRPLAALPIGHVTRHDGCVPDESDFVSTEEAMAQARAATKIHGPRFLGLNESEALALADQLGMELRVIRDDHTALHLDFRPHRMTVDIRSGVATRAEVG